MYKTITIVTASRVLQGMRTGEIEGEVGGKRPKEGRYVRENLRFS